MPGTIKIIERFSIECTGVPDQIIKIFEEAVKAAHCEDLTGNDQPIAFFSEITKKFWVFLGWAEKTWNFDKKQYTLDEKPLTAVKDYINKLTAYLHENCDFQSKDLDKDLVKSHTAIIRHLMMAIATYALSNEAAEAPDIQNDTSGISKAINLLKLLQIFSEKISAHMVKKDTKLYRFLNNEHSALLDQLADVSEKQRVLRSDVRILIETKTYLEAVSYFLKRVILLRSGHYHGQELTVSSFKDDMIDTMYDDVLKAAIGGTKFNEYRIDDNWKNTKLTQLALGSVRDIEQKKILERLYELYSKHQDYMGLISKFSDLNRSIGWLVFLSGIVDLKALGNALATHIKEVKNATVYSQDDPVANSLLLHALEKSKVFRSGEQHPFYNFSSLENPDLLQMIHDDIMNPLKDLLKLSTQEFFATFLRRERINSCISKMEQYAPSPSGIQNQPIVAPMPSVSKIHEFKDFLNKKDYPNAAKTLADLHAEDKIQAKEALNPFFSSSKIFPLGKALVTFYAKEKKAKNVYTDFNFPPTIKSLLLEDANFTLRPDEWQYNKNWFVMMDHTNEGWIRIARNAYSDKEGKQKIDQVQWWFKLSEDGTYFTLHNKKWVKTKPHYVCMTFDGRLRSWKGDGATDPRGHWIITPKITEFEENKTYTFMLACKAWDAYKIYVTGGFFGFVLGNNKNSPGPAGEFHIEACHPPQERNTLANNN